ncbi:shikimate dehydrogenase [Aliidiomarina shirensis]|uniref:Shikimate dehydrogenase (NADP(+)) n=1 Tax=Aliidiomarina shirensis TaxID=1048642 RepID=A0A432WP23_9GAMM|nr:shikimate dehydrogenase [Aliidiomarina shirensis]RUO35552.1 shikimate dehydrogenase [Aliidiomarina shirensis]
MKLAVFGSPIAHSRSPEIHQAFAMQHGRTIEYARILASPEQFAECFQAFVANGGVGANVTVPLKEQALSLCSTLSSRATQAQAVNTLILRDGEWLGHNTDGDGLEADLLRLGMKLRGARVLVLGAGGAVRGIIGPMLDAEVAHLHIANRTEAKAQNLVSEWQQRLAGELEMKPKVFSTLLSAGGLSSAAGSAENGSWDIVINATSSGLTQERPEIPEATLANKPFCYDMVYGSKPTAFMQWAEERGCAVSDGLGMLIEQAALSYFQWFGDIPDTKVVLDSVRSQL